MSEDMHGQCGHTNVHLRTMSTFLGLLTIQTPVGLLWRDKFDDVAYFFPHAQQTNLESFTNTRFPFLDLPSFTVASAFMVMASWLTIPSYLTTSFVIVSSQLIDMTSLLLTLLKVVSYQSSSSDEASSPDTLSSLDIPLSVTSSMYVVVCKGISGDVGE